jgi:alpha-mannosidase
MLAVTGLNAELRISNLNALRLGVGDWNNQGCDAEPNQEQACKQQNFHIALISTKFALRRAA